MIVKLQQGTDEWRAWREHGIGGSDAGTIMCENPYETIYALWARKTGQRKPKKENAAMARGNKLEDAGRMAFCQKLGELLPAACCQHDEFSFMRCSLDGRNPEGLIGFELKIPETPHSHVVALEGQVPRRYYGQCQHNLFVSGCKELYFVSWYPSHNIPLAEVKVLPDAAYLAELVPAEREFWKWVVEKHFPFEAPPKQKGAKASEANMNTDPEWIKLAGELWEAGAMRAVAEEREDLIKSQMTRLAMKTGANRVRGAGVLATWVHTHEYTMTKPETKYLRIGHSATGEDQ